MNVKRLIVYQESPGLASDEEISIMARLSQLELSRRAALTRILALVQPLQPPQGSTRTGVMTQIMEECRTALRESPPPQVTDRDGR